MSQKAFYETFFQTEQLFRLADEPMAFAATPPPVVALQARLAPAEPVQAPPVQILDPVARPIPAPVIPPAEPPAYVPEPKTEPTPPAAPEAAREGRTRQPATPQLNQKVLILVDEALTESDLLFLENILKAVHLDVTGIDLLNLHGTRDLDFRTLLTNKVFHHFFTFGVPFSRLDLDILMDRYQPVRFDGITFMMADSLPVIEANTALKRQLWQALQKLFLWK